MDASLFSLQDRAALVTGANRGLGRAMALAFRDMGAQVAVTGRDAGQNERIAEELGDASVVFELEIRDEPNVQRVVDGVVERFGRLDILVNNVGYAQVRPVTEATLDEWNAILALNLTGSFLCAKYAARHMMAQGSGGKIINIGSIYSLFGTPNFASYGAAKAGVLGLTRSLAVELARHQIQVNAILPGWHVTDRTQRMQGSPLADQIRRKTPANRWGQPEDVVGAAVFLASRASDFVTGACIPVDGGYSVAERLLYE